MQFTAHVQTGSGRGKTIGTPTINVELDDVPNGTEEGIYACWVKLTGTWHAAALHYGPRPVFKDTPSCEVHVLDHEPIAIPTTLTIILVERLRDVLDFPSIEQLQAQIAEDITQTRAILKEHGPPHAQTADS